MDRMNLFPIPQQILNNQASQRITTPSKTFPDKKADSPAEKLSELQKGAEAFEAYFIQSLLKEMRKGISPETKTGTGMGESIYTSMFDEAIAEKIAARGGIGLSKLLIEKLSESLQFSGQAADKIKE